MYISPTLHSCVAAADVHELGGRGRAVRCGLCMGECRLVQAELEERSDRAGVACAAGLVSQARRMDRRCRRTQSR